MREVGEELGVEPDAATLEPIGIFQAQADGKPRDVGAIACFSGDFDGELAPRAEIAELAWLGCADRERLAGGTPDPRDAPPAGHGAVRPNGRSGERVEEGGGFPARPGR